MDADLYKAAIRGNTDVLDETKILRHGEDYYLKKSLEANNNIIHLAAQHCRVDFLTVALRRFPTQLVLHKNKYGDTPLHVAAAASRSGETVKLLISHLNLVIASNNVASSSTSAPTVPFFMENEQGDTPFHVAIRNDNLQAVQQFLDTVIPNHPHILGVVNKSNETPLHLFVRYCTARGVAKTWMEEESNYCLINVIGGLLSPYPDAVCSHDKEGLTPLLRAARNGDLWVSCLLIEHSPQSAEVCDNNGRNVLHLITSSSQDYKELKQLIGLPEISILKNRQDCQGNTPAHCAVLDHALTKISVLSESLADLTIRNENGLSARDLIDLESDQNMKRAMKRAFFGRIMDDRLYTAAQEGDASVLPKQDDVPTENDYCLSLAHDGSNTIHLAIGHGQISFIEQALKSFPSLIFQKNLNGDTPLHIAARLPTPAALMILKLSCNDLWEKTLKHCKLSFPYPPWMVKCFKGNTLLHEATRTSNYNGISLLLNFMDLEDISNANDNSETSLHLFARYGTYAAANTLKEVQELVEKSTSAAYMTDVDGLTPVSRAVQCGRLRVAMMLLSHYPRSATIPDHHGRTLLHHLRASVAELVDDSISILHFWEELFSFSVVKELRTVQDQNGNTPLHAAIINCNVAAAKFLMNKCLNSDDGMEELSIINDHGSSVYNLLESETHNPHMKELKELVTMSKSYIKERALERQKMDDTLYEMVIKGEAHILDPNGTGTANGSLPYEDHDFLRVTPDGSNILHIALKYAIPKQAEDFVEKALNRIPSLVLQPDCNGDTPLHTAAKVNNPASIALVKRVKMDFEKARDEGRQGIYVAPWKLKNCNGNMPIHEALQRNNMDASNLLLDADPDSVSYENDLGETPLHIFAKYGQSCIDERPSDLCPFVARLATGNTSAVYVRDGEGLTPILRAAKSGRLGAVISLLELFPQAAYHRDPNGRTLMHLLNFTNGDVAKFSFEDVYKLLEKDLFKRPDVDAQVSVQDNDGETAFHSAIKTSNSLMADALVKRILGSSWKDRLRLLNLANKEGQTVIDLLAANEDHGTIRRLRCKNWRVDWPSHSYRVPEVAIKDTVQSLSVIAGLLATITFAAALQVPGGFDSKNGSPVALKKAAFQVFLVSDTVAMCTSMMVLFCLLWAIRSAKVKDSRFFLDFSLQLLFLSFTAALVAFMSGVYVVTAEKTFWLSILVCVFCSVTVLYRYREFIVFCCVTVLWASGAQDLGIGEPMLIEALATTWHRIRDLRVAFHRPLFPLNALQELRQVRVARGYRGPGLWGLWGGCLRAGPGGLGTGIGPRSGGRAPVGLCMGDGDRDRPTPGP